MTWQEINRKRSIYANRWTRLLKRSLKKQVKTVIEALGNDSAESVIDRIDLLVKDKEIRDSFRLLYSDVGRVFAMDAYREIKPKGAEEQILEDIYFQDMLKYAEVEAGIRIVSITGGSQELAKRLLRQLLKDSVIPEGWGIEKTARYFQKEFEQMYGKYDLWRARRIAQTEVLTASNRASQMGAIGAGANTKIWQVQPGRPKNERHTTYPGLHEQERPMDEPFDVGGFPAMFPGDPSLPPGECINCHCAQIFKRI